MNLKPCLQEDSLAEKENIKVRCLLFVLTIMRLVTLQQDVLKTRIEDMTKMKINKKVEMRNMRTNIKEERMMTTKALRIKVRNLDILLKKKVIVSLACLIKWK